MLYGSTNLQMRRRKNARCSVRSLPRRKIPMMRAPTWVLNQEQDILSGLASLTLLHFAIWPLCWCDYPSVSVISTGTPASSISHLYVSLFVYVNLSMRSLIIRQDIPYIRALRAIPREMRDKLPPEFLGILDIIVSLLLFLQEVSFSQKEVLTGHKHFPKVELLHHGIRDLALFYQERFHIKLPPLNSPLLLYRHIKRLAIPSRRNLKFLSQFCY